MCHVNNVHKTKAKVYGTVINSLWKVTFSTKDYSFKIVTASPQPQLTLRLAGIIHCKIYASFAIFLFQGEYIKFSLFVPTAWKARKVISQCSWKHTTHLPGRNAQALFTEMPCWVTTQTGQSLITREIAICKIISANKGTKWSRTQWRKRTGHREGNTAFDGFPQWNYVIRIKI